MIFRFQTPLIEQRASGDPTLSESRASLVRVRLAAAGRPTITVYRRQPIGQTRAVPAPERCADWEDLRAVTDFILGFDLLAVANFFLRL